jgi:hypothetical protein
MNRRIIAFLLLASLASGCSIVGLAIGNGAQPAAPAGNTAAREQRDSRTAALVFLGLIADIAVFGYAMKDFTLLGHEED